MTPIKNFTDITQSKKLAKILPLKSADAFYDSAEPEKRQRVIVGSPDEYFDMEDWAIPCWSLVALFSILPKSAYLEKGSSTELCRVTLPVELISSDWNLEPIDACYEMIIKLHKEGLL